MASKGTGTNRDKWRARVKVDGMDIFLGYFFSREEAEKTENEFRRNLNLPERVGRYYADLYDQRFTKNSNARTRLRKKLNANLAKST